MSGEATEQPAGKIYIGLAVCRTCGVELNRTKPLTEKERNGMGAMLSGPFVTIGKCGHSTFSDLNWNYEMKWYEQGSEPAEPVPASKS